MPTAHFQKPLRVVYSFPHKLGAGRIADTAWEQVNGLAAAGAQVTVFPGVLHRAVDPAVQVKPTLTWGKLRLPYKLFGTTRTSALHDLLVANRLKNLAGKIDVVHTWPVAARRTLKMARRLGIATVLERPNAHTRFAYEVVQKECERLGVELPATHEHAFNHNTLRIEEEEYQLADGLLCPSDFVVKTFLDQGFQPKQLVRHIYGFDERRFYPEARPPTPQKGLTMVFVGVCAVRKGLHFALEAWLNSPASREGKFLIAGEFLPAYQKKLAPMLAHPSIQVLGHRKDVPELMRQSDLLVLPSIEEGSALVVGEAMGSGCVPLVSEATSGITRHMVRGMVHKTGDVKTLSRHMTQLHEDRELLAKLRANSLAAIPDITWTAAGVKLIEAYHEVLKRKRN